MILSTLLVWLREFGADLAGILFSLIILAVYYAVHRARARRDPTYSIHLVNDNARRIWVEGVMSDPEKAIMAVQTLRNFIMYPILMVSTASILIIGTLTLSGQAESISRSWHAINFIGSHSTELWIIKVMCLLADFLVAFFAYAMSIRLASHVLFMLNVPKELMGKDCVLSATLVANRLNQAGHLVAVGMRAFIFAIPLVFWLFGPIYLALATLGVVVLLLRIDRL